MQREKYYIISSPLTCCLDTNVLIDQSSQQTVVVTILGTLVQRFGHLDKMPFIMKLRAWAQVLPQLLKHSARP